MRAVASRFAVIVLAAMWALTGLSASLNGTAFAANDETGIEIATGHLEQDLRRVAEARAEVGVRARRVSDAILRQEDLRIQDMGLKSQVQDLDYTEAAVRFSTLQQQLQAGLTVASQMSTLSLLDFLR